jgi:hypothetical protein
MVYADYEFYQNEYYGQTITEDEFPRLALRASSFLDYYTQNRAGGYPDLPELKMACCAVAEQYAIMDAAQKAAQTAVENTADNSAEVQSESVGSWSKTYRSGGSTAQEALDYLKNANAYLAAVAGRYLANTGLLYRGRRCPL